MDNLIHEAYQLRQERPVLGLCVRPTNTRAIELYRKKHFNVDLDPYTDKRTGVQYARMARILDPVRLEEMVNELAKKKR
jgi:ribosomal protein S18 acetylase RimI-like enzyme